MGEADGRFFFFFSRCMNYNVIATINYQEWCGGRKLYKERKKKIIGEFSILVMSKGNR